MEDEPTQPGKSSLFVPPHSFSQDPLADDDGSFEATQLIIDPRRLGHGNSGLNDEDLSDIFCILHPASKPAYKAAAHISKATPQHTISAERGVKIRQKVEGPHQEHEDVGTLDLATQGIVSCDLALRLSANLKDTALGGFSFGRHRGRCDIVLGQDDVVKRVSNVHFRIYINAYGVIMLEDQSTNGTVVDGVLLRAKDKENGKDYRHTLELGSMIILTMTPPEEDFRFIVRIPQRDDIAESVYQNNLTNYFLRQNRAQKANRECVPDESKAPPTRESPNKNDPPAVVGSPDQSFSSVGRFVREWRGGNKYNKVGTIGKGAFAVVYKLTTKFDGIPFAAKELEKRRFMKNGVLDQKVDMEMNIMRKLKHPNIVQFIEHIDWEEHLYIVMEYVPSGDLGSLIHKRGRLPEAEVKLMASQLLSAFKYLHEMGVTHRDVKPDNILIQSHNPLHVKLTDFGLSKMVDGDDTFLRTFCGTLLYCAPEVYSEYREYDISGKRNLRGLDKSSLPPQRYGHAVDIWSLAGVLFYSLSGTPPYPVTAGITFQELLNRMMTKPLDIRPLQLANVSESGIRFIKSMLHIRPEHRATIADLESSSWLTGEDSIEASTDELDEVDMVGNFDDRKLEQGASQLSIHDQDEREIGDSEANVSDLTELLQPEIPSSFNTSDDSMGNGNESFGFMANTREIAGNGRLFGEVDASAIGSSGVIPLEQLPLPEVSHDFPSHSFSRESLYAPNEFGEHSSLEDSQSQQPEAATFTTNSRILPAQSQTPSTPDTQSAKTRDTKGHATRSSSLMGAESMVGHLNMDSPPPVTSPAGDKLNKDQTTVTNTGTSLRRPREEDEYEINEPWRPSDLPPVKRFKNNAFLNLKVPSSMFWDPADRSTHHTDYPSMTTAEFNALTSYAQEKGEKFRHGGNTFETVMRSFRSSRSPSLEPDAMNRALSEPINEGGRRMMMKRDERKLGQQQSTVVEAKDSPMPSTARGSREPEHQTFEHGNTANVPISAAHPVVGNDFQRPKRILGKIVATPDSCLPTITLNITETLTSWGRGFSNTIRYTNGQEIRVPKYAFKIFLFKPGFYTVSGALPSNVAPGNEKNSTDQQMAFYISTKATFGIYVNGISLRSNDRQKPFTPSKFWGELRDGDLITVWRHDSDHSQYTQFKFECYWGLSKQPRKEGERFQVLAEGDTLSEIEHACHAQQEILLAEIDRRMAEEKLAVEEDKNGKARREVAGMKSKPTTNFTQSFYGAPASD